MTSGDLVKGPALTMCLQIEEGQVGEGTCFSGQVSCSIPWISRSSIWRSPPLWPELGVGEFLCLNFFVFVIYLVYFSFCYPTVPCLV